MGRRLRRPPRRVLRVEPSAGGHPGVPRPVCQRPSGGGLQKLISGAQRGGHRGPGGHVGRQAGLVALLVHGRAGGPAARAGPARARGGHGPHPGNLRPGAELHPAGALHHTWDALPARLHAERPPAAAGGRGAAWATSRHDGPPHATTGAARPLHALVLRERRRLLDRHPVRAGHAALGRPFRVLVRLRHGARPPQALRPAPLAEAASAHHYRDARFHHAGALQLRHGRAAGWRGGVLRRCRRVSLLHLRGAAQGGSLDGPLP
mmetsp:Transcript_69161/g.185353  ORF Transcript_69161/g.185353 Transcript_69161/m.185353 type:complete len:263 (+) Transcript_69161:318-1106(+)